VSFELCKFDASSENLHFVVLGMLDSGQMLWLSLSVLTAIFPCEPVMDDGGGGDNWSYNMCKASVKSSPPTNHNTQLFTGWMSFLSSNQQCHSTEGKDKCYAC